jgi:hypothetical protein
MSSSFQVNISFQGKSTNLSDVTTSITASALYQQTLEALELSDETQLKLLLKGKIINTNDTNPIFPSIPHKIPKLIVMATSTIVAKEMASKRSDPTIRGFDQEIPDANKKAPLHHWGEGMLQNKNYKFCRFEACTWQSFGHRPTEKTPHAFRAMELLEKLATDPGIVAILKERELVVGTLGEMDPIDDRIMHKKQQEGACLLGYNTNGGQRIDLKLRTEDLQDFRPYPQIVATLIHELSHNWVGEHNALFWANYAQMRAEYLYTHARLRSTVHNGKTTAEFAGLDKAKLENVFEFIMSELVGEMAQHGLHPNMIATSIQERCRELEQISSGQRLGGGGDESTTRIVGENGTGSTGTARERALAAAERRARKQQEQDE